MHLLKRLFQRRRMTDDLSEEMRQHLDEKIEALVERGMPREEAVHAARRAFGNATLLEQRGREVWMWPWIESIWADVKFALRQLRKSPGFTVTTVLTLALGIGANTAVFSIMDAVVLRPLAVPDLGQVVTVAEEQNSRNYKPVALANYADWKRQSRSFEELAVRTYAYLSLSGAGNATHVQAAYTSASFFDILRAKPILGRVFGDEESQPGRDNVAILSYSFWQTQFGADPKVLGRRLQLNQRTFTVIGVMPKTLQYPSAGDLFLPFAPSLLQLDDRETHDYLVIGRLHRGVTVRKAQTEMAGIAERLSKAYPATNLGWSVRVEPLLDGINGTLTPMYFHMVLGATAFLLLIVCANVANLQFARGVARYPEMAIRTALGAGRWRVLRQLMAESILLGMLGAAIGIAMAEADLHFALISMPERVARFLAGWSNISVNSRVLGFSIVLAVGGGVVSGLAPALEALRVNLVDQLKVGSKTATGSRRTHLLRNIFAVVQISLAVALVVGAALICKGMWTMLHLADVYEPSRVLTFNIYLPNELYGSPKKLSAWYDTSLQRLSTLPGVRDAQITTTLPYSNEGPVMADVQIEHHASVPGKFHIAQRLAVSSGYFSLMHIPVMAGRSFGVSDGLHTPPVVIVSHTFAAKYFPGENPLGNRIRLGAAGQNNER